MAKIKINIVLIFLVLGLWGTVIYRSVSRYLFHEETVKEIQKSKKNFSSLTVKDTFHLDNIEKDPFLNKEYITTPSIPTVKKIRKEIPILTPKKMNMLWPAITYYGYIISKSKNEKTVLVKINQTIHKLKKNAQVEGLVLNKVYNDSIEVLFNKEKKIFWRNK